MRRSADPAALVVSIALLVSSTKAVGGPPQTQPLPAAAQPSILWARSAILIDQDTGRTLFERNADEPLPPASLAKLVTLHVVYQKLAERAISRDDVVWYSPKAYARSQRPDSSLMNLQPGFVVTVEELMKGVAVQSGNDAAVALAEFVAGDVDTFVAWMNEESRLLGTAHTFWADPAGAGQGSVTTAREFAAFSRHYIAQHPESLQELHSLREFQFPQSHNLPEGSPAPEGVVTYNHNWLVQGFGVDGLKTGRWDNSNFTIAITAQRGDCRLVAVLLGVPGSTVTEGSLRRSEDALALLAWGFRTFTTARAEVPPISAVRVWKGAEETVDLVPPAGPLVTIRNEEAGILEAWVEAPREAVAPVRRGQKLGELVYRAGDAEVSRYELVAASDVEEAGLLRRAWDSVLMAVGRLLGGPKAPSVPQRVTLTDQG